MVHPLAFLWLFLLAFSAFAAAHEEKKLDVLTSLGLVRGFRHRLQQPAAENGNGQEIGVFFGIPFARPPVGKLRFEKPQPPSKWRGVRAADTQKSACIYHAWPEGLGKKSYSEDCLYMNIFAPIQNSSSNHSTVQSSLFPVLVIIHGGGFEVGSSHTYNNFEDIGTKFVSRGILVVAFDYRLGWMGFGSTGTEEMPGNLGLWDQLAALQFIRANIRAFGGDPEQITLYGYSAGSASVSLLSISPLSRDLFSRAIQMSGSPLASWALNERSVNETLVLARELGCPSGGSIKQCLTERPIAEIWSAVDRIGPTRYEDVNFAKWSPRVDGDFLPADVPQLLRQARPKPTLMGFVELESLCWMNSTLAAFAVPWAQLALYDRARFEDSVSALVAKSEFFGDLAGEVRDVIVEQYVKEDLLAEFCALHQLPMGQYYLQRYTQMLSDLNFIVPILAELEQRTLLGWPIHFYMNVHYNRLEFPGPVKVHQNFHTNDENFLFRESHFPFTFDLSDDDRQVEGHLVQIVTNFAKFGNPSPNAPLDVSPGVDWLPTSAQWPTQHLRIMPAPKLEQQMEADVLDRFQFWRGFVQKYGHRWNPVRGARGPGKSPAKTE